MAIIYTYPKLTNPQGNELIVVSDVNNKNATRLITIADIASLVPGGGGGGCSSAIAGILTGAGNYIPPLCNEVTFTGSGIDISADQASATITFTVPPVSIPCADAEIAGTVKITDPVITNELTLANDGTYYAVQINEECKLGVRIPEGQSYELPCATTSELGGIKVGNIEQGITPTIEAEGTAYSLERNENCEGFIRVPSAEIQCANTVTIGGLKVGNIDETAAPVTGSGTPTFIETNSACEGFVRIPEPAEDATLVATQSGGTNDDPNLTLTSGLNVDNVKLVGGSGVDVTRNSDTEIEISATSFGVSCANASLIGGIKASKVDTTLPDPADEGEYYPIQLIESETGPIADECRAVVRVPSSGGVTPGNGQITIAAGTGLTGGGSFTVNQAGNSTITLNASGSGGGETGWSPMTITNSATTLPVQESDPLTLFFHATADATLDINSIKMMLTEVDAAGNANKDDDFSVALYEGSLTDVANGGPAPTLIGSWTYSPGGVAVYGVKKVFNAVATSVTAGNDYVIAVSVRANGAQLLGDGVIYGGFGSLFMANQYLCVGNNNAYGTPLAAEWPSSMPDTTFTSTYRYAIHFYEGGE